MQCLNNIKCLKHKEDYKMKFKKENNGENNYNRRKKHQFTICNKMTMNNL